MQPDAVEIGHLVIGRVLQEVLHGQVHARGFVDGPIEEHLQARRGALFGLIELGPDLIEDLDQAIR